MKTEVNNVYADHASYSVSTPHTLPLVTSTKNKTEKMNRHLKCFISASFETETDIIKSVLDENGVDVFDLYDFSIGGSIQQILKRKLRQSDFAIFILTEENKNVLYEMGVCEGLGKQHFIFLDKKLSIPFYVTNKFFIHTDLNDRVFLKNSIEKILQDVSTKRLKTSRSSTEKETKKDNNYDRDTRDSLESYLPQIQRLRETGTGLEMETVIEDIFKTLKLNYVNNKRGRDKGVDFALWNDELGKIIGNPIIVEAKYGNLSSKVFENAEQQIRNYIEKSDAKIALFLYLDKRGKRHRIKSSLRPLFMSYDLEDFARDLTTSSFERIILNQRNKIAHGIE